MRALPFKSSEPHRMCSPRITEHVAVNALTSIDRRRTSLVWSELRRPQNAMLADDKKVKAGEFNKLGPCNPCVNPLPIRALYTPPTYCLLGSAHLSKRVSNRCTDTTGTDAMKTFSLLRGGYHIIPLFHEPVGGFKRATFFAG